MSLTHLGSQGQLFHLPHVLMEMVQILDIYCWFVFKFELIKCYSVCNYIREANTIFHFILDIKPLKQTLEQFMCLPGLKYESKPLCIEYETNKLIPQMPFSKRTVVIFPRSIDISTNEELR